MDMAVQRIVTVILPWLALKDKAAARPIMTAVTADT